MDALGDDGTLWSSIILRDGNESFSERAIGIAVFGEESFIVAVERTIAGSSLTLPVLYRVAPSGSILWARITNTTKGTPHHLVVDKERKTAYILISSQQLGTSSHTNGCIIRFQGFPEFINSEGAHPTISEDLFFRTESGSGNTKLFGCALEKTSGDLYVTGGSTQNLYGTSQGKSDVIAVRISSSGIIMATAQFGTAQDEFGTAIDVSTKSAVVAVSVYRILSSGGTESVLYHLHLKTLAIIDGPTTLMNYAAVPLFTPSDIAIGEPMSSEPNTMFTAICGGALTVPDRGNDVFLHVYTTISGVDANVAVYVDGAADQKENDYAVALKAGVDGNIYSVGYSRGVDSPFSASVILVVISPTGEILYRNGRAKDNRSDVVPSAMALFWISDETRIAFVGYVQTGSTRKAALGTAIPPVDKIPVFRGFGEIAEETGTHPQQSPESTDGPTSVLTIIISAAVPGILILLIGFVAFLLFRAQ